MGTLEPNKESMPKEKAISVAEGIAQPFKVSVSPKLTHLKFFGMNINGQ